MYRRNAFRTDVHALMRLDHLALLKAAYELRIHYSYKLCLNALKVILNETSPTVYQSSISMLVF